MNNDNPAVEAARAGPTANTEAGHSDDDPYRGQPGGKLNTSSPASTGNPANDVINPDWQSAQDNSNPPHAGDHAAAPRTDAVGDVKGTKGSGTPTLSGAGKLADDRPGRDEPKSDHASSSLNTHE